MNSVFAGCSNQSSRPLTADDIIKAKKKAKLTQSSSGIPAQIGTQPVTTPRLLPLPTASAPSQVLTAPSVQHRMAVRLSCCLRTTIDRSAEPCLAWHLVCQQVANSAILHVQPNPVQKTAALT